MYKSMDKGKKSVKKSSALYQTFIQNVIYKHERKLDHLTEGSRFIHVPQTPSGESIAQPGALPPITLKSLI